MKQKITLLKSVLVIFASVLAGSNLYAQTLVAHYKFDGNLLDETSTFNLSESSNYTASFVTGQNGTESGAVSGFGVADYLESTTDFSISGDQSRTMAAWIKTPEFVNSGQAIVGLGIQGKGLRWTFQVLGTKLRVEINGSGYNEPTIFTADTWYHVAVVFDNSFATDNVVLYINGERKSTRSWDGIVNTTVSKLRVGNDFNVVDGDQKRGFKGSIDDLRIYSDAASDAFISTLYSDTLLGVATQNNQTSFNTYPNPVNNRLYFSTEIVDSVEVFNIQGSKISDEKVANNSIDTSGLSKGLYLVRCLDTEGSHITTLKVIKE